MIRIAVIVCALLVSSVVNAEVNYRSGNYYMEMLEFVIPTGGKALEVKRVYNSRSKHLGAFGFGWSFNFDIKLKILPGGHALIIDEDGRKIKLRSKSYKKLLKADMENFAKASSDKKAAKRIAHIKDPEDVGRVFAKNGVVPHTPKGTVYIGYGGWRGYETIKKVGKGWIRVIGHNGEKQLFDLAGRLVKFLDPNGNFILLTYKRNKLYQIINPFKGATTFSWDKRNFIKSIRSLDNQLFKYSYNSAGALVSVKHPKFGLTKFEYNRVYNLTKITYSTGDTKRLTYNDKMDMVISEKGPGLLDVKYTYGTDPRDKKHYWTTISVPFGNGYKQIDRWEYWEDKDKYVRIKDGSRIVTRFSKFGSGNPSYISRDGKVTKFKYNSQGQPTERTLPDGSKITTQYNRKFGKPKKVVDGKDTYYYSYDGRGNIVKASNNKGLKVQILYDSRGRIKTLKNNKKGTLHFDFNQMGKPTKIKKSGVGVVNIWYDSTGKIIKIKTKPKGGRIASIIIASFNELFGLLKYAGI